MKTAYSGREARGLAPSSPYPDSPFQESFQYDAFNNRIQKNGRFWRSSQSGSTACVPRQQADGCDSEGNLKNFLYDEHSYDAAGEQLNFKNWRNTVGGSPNHLDVLPTIEISQTYDSDGRPAKRIETRRTQELIGSGPQTNILSSETATYYLYSTVLGGAKIVELGGERVSTTYVYANGLRIAKQNIEQNSNESWVSWNHVNPGSNSFVETHSDTSIRLEERDPDGAEMGTEDPLANVVEPPTYENLKGEEPLYIEGGDPYNYSGTLTIDGLPVSQAEFNRRMQNGSAGAQVSVGGHPMVFVTNQQQLQHITLDVFQVDNELQGRPQSERWGGTYYRGTIDVNLTFAGPAPYVPGNPQNPQNYAQQRQELKGDKDLHPPTNIPINGNELTHCVKEVLSKYFDAHVLAEIRIHDQGLPWFVPAGITAYTASVGDIYFAKGQYNPHTQIGIALIAHEIVHIMQRRKYGDDPLSAVYLVDSLGVFLIHGWHYDAEDNDIEKPAYAKEREILEDLEKRFGKGKDPCP